MSLIFREMQIEITMGYNLTLVRMVTINTSTSVGEDVEKREPLCTVGGNVDWCSHCGKQYGVNLKKLKMELLHDPVIPILAIYLKKPKTLIQENICTSIFIAALFTIANIWK